MKTSRGRNKVYVACTYAEVSVQCKRGDHQSLRECLHVSMCGVMIVICCHSLVSSDMAQAEDSC